MGSQSLIARARAAWGAHPEHRPIAVGFVIAFVVMHAVGYVPLFGGPGYEHALATGLVCPSIAAVTTALAITRRAASPLERRGSPAASLLLGCIVGGTLALVSLGSAFVHGLFGGVCDLGGAVVYFALTAFAGSVLGGAWGAFAGELALRITRKDSPRARRWRGRFAVLLALSGPIATIAVSVVRFLSSPMIFAFDPFVGFFSGTLYDTVIQPGTPLLTYRLGSVLTLASAALASSLVTQTADGAFALSADTALARARLGLCVVLGLGSLAVTASGTKLGHFSTSASIASDLGAEKHGAQCDVVYPSTVREDQANLLVKDCDEQLRAVEGRLGATESSRVRAFFFRDAEDKKRLMGAANTYIAKPWRKEVYLQLASYPHPVLGHELAHVVAGTFGRGPFRIAGSLGGLVPNPGLIEGIAVYASPDDDALTDGEWAAAMDRLGLLGPIEHVFSLRFLGETSQKSYTLAGAFVDWIASTHGKGVLRAWYAGGDLTALTGQSWSSLDKAFRDDLAGLSVSPDTLAFARAKFDRPGIFGRTCPHVVDALRGEADTCRDTQRFEEALRLYAEVLTKDPNDFASRTSRAAIERRHGDREAGRAALLAIVQNTTIPRPYRDRAAEALADAAFVDGAFDEAAAAYAALAEHTLDEDGARNLEVKAFGARDATARQAIRWLLIGNAGHGPDVFFAGVALGRWENATASPLAHYLVGRNLLHRGLYEEGARELSAAVERLGELPSPRIAREALRQRAIGACALDERYAVRKLEARLEAPGEPFQGGPGGRRAATLRLLERCHRP